MSLALYDAYLAPRLTPERQARAYADVDAFGRFDADWRERLAALRAAILVCVDMQEAPDDLFGAKLATYRKLFDEQLALARNAQPAPGSSATRAWLTVPLERA